MKIFTFISILFLAISTFGQNSLSIDFEPKKDIFGSDYHIFKNDSLIYTNCSTKNNSEILYQLKKGTYLIKYNTIYGIDSLTIDFKEKNEFKSVTLKTESIEESKLKNTHSEIESLKEHEKIIFEYDLGGCFVSENIKITLTKEKNKFYKIERNKRKRINQKKIQELIQYEKMLRNLNIEDDIDGTFRLVTCSEFISIKKNNEQIFGKNIFCGDWSKSSEIKKLIK